MFKTWLADLQKVQLSINSMSNISPLKDWDLWNDGSLKDNVLKQYTESINGLSLKQAELALSTKGLTKTQQEQILVEAGLLASSEKISASLVQEALSVSGLSVETQKAILLEAGLMDANTGELLTTKACTEEKLRSILATKGIVGTNADAIVSSVGLGTANTTTSISFSTLTKSVKANTAALLEWMLTNPVGWLTLICTSVYGLTKLADLLTTSIDEQTEKLNTAKESYESVSSELENNETELKNIIARIDELNAKDKLTFVEQAELDNLKATNEELERTIQLNKEKKAQEEDNYADELYKTYNQRITQDNMNGSFKEQVQYYLDNKDLLNRTDIDKHKHNLQWLIAKYESLYNPTKVGTKWYDEQIKSLKSYITDATSEYNELYGNINSLNEETLKEHPELTNAKKNLQQILEYSDKIRNVADYRQKAYSSILSSDVFKENSDFKNKLTSYLTKGGSFDTDSLKQKFGEDIVSSLQAACEDGGLTLESFINEMYSQATDNQSQKLEIKMPSIGGTLTGNEFADALKQNMEQLVNDSNKLSILADNTTTEITKSLSDKFKDLWNSKSFADVKEDLSKLADESKITASDINDLAKENVELADLLDESGMSAQFVAECFDSMCRGGKGFDAITSDALLLDQVLNGMAGSLEQATQSKSEYDKAMSKEDYNANFKNYQEAYSSAMEMFNKGEYGKHFRDTMEYLLGTDSYTMSIDEMYSAVKNLGSVFGESATNGYEFLDKLWSKKEVLDDLDSSLTKLSDGSYDFDLKPDEFEAIANALGMTTEEVAACTNALGMFGDYSSYDLDELELALNSISIAAHDGEKSITSLQGVENILSDLGYSGYDVYQIMQQIQDMGTIELIDFEEGNLDDTLSKLKELENVKIDGSNIDLDSLITGMQALGNSDVDIANFIDRLNGQFNLTDAEGKLVDFETAKNRALSATKNGVSDDLSKVGEEAETTTNKVSNVNTEMDTLNKKTLSQVQLQFVNVSTAANTAKENVQKIIDKINDLNGKKINPGGNTNSNDNTKSDGKGYHGTVGNAYAKGTTQYDDIPNLPITGYNGLPKDEKNAVRSEYGQQELTVYPNGKTELTSQPTMSDLPKGTVIFNERQTKKMLNGTKFVSGNAYASGTVTKNKLPKSSGNSSSKTSSSDKDNSKSKTLIDWIARRLDVLQTKAERWAKIIENATDSTKITKYYNKLESVYKKQVKTTYDAASRYLSKANSIKISKDSKKDKDLKAKIQSKDSSLFTKDGNLKSYKTLIKQYGEKTAEAISNYQDYYDKYQSAIDSYIEACESLYNAPIEEASAKIELLAKDLELLDAKLENATVDGYNDANALIDKQVTNQKNQEKANKSAYDTAKSNLNSAKKAVDSNSDLKKYSDLTKAERAKVLKAVRAGQEIDITLFKEGSKGYKKALAYNAALQARNDAEQEYQLAVQETVKIEREAEKQKFDNIQNYYEKQIELIQIQEDAIQQEIDLTEARGITVIAKSYEQQIQYEKDKQKQLQTSKDLLTKQLSEIEKGTEEWHEANSALADVDAELQECNITIAEMNHSITELADNFQEKMSKTASTIREVMDWSVSLMDEYDKFDSKTGAMTKEGLASLGSYVSNRNNSSAMADNYGKQVAKMEEEYTKYEKIFDHNNPTSYEFIDANGIKRTYNSLEEFKSAIDSTYESRRDQISETAKYESQVIDFMRQKYENELSALKELIDAKSELLEREADLKKYQKSVRESTDNISSLQKQIQALQQDSSEENQMRLQKLNKELEESKEELAEKEDDRRLSELQDSLDGLYSEYEDLIQSELSDVKGLLEKGNAIAEKNADAISSTIKTYAQSYDYNGRFDNIDSGLNLITEDKPESILGLVKSIANEGVKPETTNDNNNSGNASNTTNQNGTVTLPDGSTRGTGYIPLGATNMQVITSESLEESIKTKAEDYILGKASKPNKKKKEYSDVNKKIWDYTKGKVLSSAELKKLAELVGVKYDNGKKSGKLYKKLKSLKIQGFSKGGVVSIDDIEKQVRTNGDTVLGSLNPDERVLTPVQNKLFEEFINNGIPKLNATANMLQPLINVPNLPNLASSHSGVTQVVQIDNITLPNVTNYEEFKGKMYQDMQHNQKFETFVRSISTDRTMGGSRLSKNSIRF